MSINIGNEGINACNALRSNESWDALRDQLGKIAMERMHSCLACPISDRIDLTAYARALYDVWVAFESATLEISQRAIEKPSRPLLPKMEGKNV